MEIDYKYFLSCEVMYVPQLCITIISYNCAIKKFASKGKNDKMHRAKEYLNQIKVVVAADVRVAK